MPEFFRHALGLTLPQPERFGKTLYKTPSTSNRIERIILGTHLERLRIKSGMSERSVERALGKYHSFVNAVEKGERYADFTAILDIVNVLGADPAEFLLEVETDIKAHYTKAKIQRPYTKPTK